MTSDSTAAFTPPRRAIDRMLALLVPVLTIILGVIIAAIFFIVLTSFSYSVGLTGLDRVSIKDRITMNVIASIPTLVSGNPMAAPVASAFKEVSRIVKTQNGKPPLETDKMQAARNKNESGDNN